MIDDNYIIDKCFVIDKNGNYKINSKLLNNITEEELNYIKNRFNDSNSINESIQRIYHKIEEKPKCPICGNPVLWLGKKNRLLLQTCSKECGFKLRQIHNEEHWKTLYGVTNVFATKECIKQIKLSKLKNHGNENYNNNEKTVKTCLEKYGVRNGGGTEESINKIKQTKLERYGDASYNNMQKCKETCLKKYGVNTPAKNEEVKEKIKQTCLKKYGKSTYLHSEEYKTHKNEYKLKRVKTLKKHNKYTDSKAEAYIYNLLTHYFNNIITHYYSELYPFYCDFYIQEIDTYIEYQGYYTHGKHAFDELSDEDQLELKKLNEKNINHIEPNNNLYYIKIQTWTKTDPYKRQIAKENKLNYLEFWNYNEIINWLKNYDKKND